MRVIQSTTVLAMLLFLGVAGLFGFTGCSSARLGGASTSPIRNNVPLAVASSHESSTPPPSQQKPFVTGEVRIGYDEIEKICEKSAKTVAVNYQGSGKEFVYLGGKADSYVDESGKPAACYTAYAAVRAPAASGPYKAVAYPLFHIRLKPVVRDGTIQVLADSGISDLRIDATEMPLGDIVNNLLKSGVISKVKDIGNTPELQEKLSSLPGLQGRLQGHIKSIVFDDGGITISGATDARGNGSATWSDLTKVPNPGDVSAVWNNGVKKEDAALIITMFHDHLWFYEKALNTSVNGGKREGNRYIGGHGGLNTYLMEDEQDPGRHRIVLYLAADSRHSNFDDRSKFLNGKFNWNDEARVIVVRAGPKYAGERFRAFEHKNFNKDGEGNSIKDAKEQTLPVGDHCLTLPEYGGIGQGTTSFEVVK